jgi:two-component sensor histidine kinase
MPKKDPPTFSDVGDSDLGLKLLDSGRLSTETIDLDKIYRSDVTKSGSFDIRQVKATSFARLLNALPIPALLVSGSHKIVFANRSCAKVSANYENVMGAPFFLLLADPAESQDADNMLGKVFSTQKSYVRELQVTIGEKTIWGRVSFRSIRITGDRLVLMLIEDLTLEKQQLQLTKRQQDELEKRVKERTEELNWINEKLMLEVAQRREAEETIKASLAEKEVMLQEIHHRVKNNLQIISSLLGMHIRQTHDESAIEALKDSQGRIKSMSLIHEQLYQSGNLAAIDFAQYLSNLTNALSQAYTDTVGSVTFKVDAAPVLFRIETAIPLGLVVSELVSNCLKHAFPGDVGGEIRVELHKGEGDEHTVVVADNGIGLPMDLDFRKAKSLGLRLVNELTESQLGGHLQIRTSNGTEIQIIFNHPKPTKGSNKEWQRQL